mgnify:CR=1 FL=1
MRSSNPLTYLSRKLSPPAQEKRRTFLKYALLGGGFFVAGKILGPSIDLFSNQNIGKVTNFENFRVVETGGELQFFDRFGNEILTLDKSV